MSLPSTIPIFPLPDVVFYPRTNLPLHVFEDRYRRMVTESLPGDRILGVVLLKEGWEQDYFGAPETYRVGCAGRMEDVVKLPDGRYLLRLEAVRKIAIDSFVRDDPYRVAGVRALEEREPAGGTAETERSRLMAAFASLAASAAGRPVGALPVDPAMDHASLVNLACMHAPVDAGEKQRLLELDDVGERGRRITVRLEEELRRMLSRPSTADQHDGGSVH